MDPIPCGLLEGWFSSWWGSVLPVGTASKADWIVAYWPPCSGVLTLKCMSATTSRATMLAMRTNDVEITACMSLLLRLLSIVLTRARSRTTTSAKSQM